ncbi:hypothetical protein BGE01nite_12690 [Brevifollis gellanilyticus]|uniref:Uncharacterized protein n=2 Tax=Brevifollis gellanilyticus TaxID=748831 RepID=A0A512M5H1_9BACT|nr:hypothetical protein BGE01nite_12690 [Brevifollis gellanilyticus]
MGDKAESPIPLKDRIYVIMRSAPASGQPDALAKILQPTAAKTLAEVMQTMKGSCPKDYPKNLFVIVYRAEAPYDGACNVAMDKALRSRFEVRPRDVIWIGYSK